jgi:hypothetical protein
MNGDRLKGGASMSDEETLSPAHQTIEFAGAKDARLLFSGPPQALRGTIPLVNTGSEKQRLQAVAIGASDLKGASGLPLREFPFYVKLYPGEQANISGRIMLDRRTRPGSYDIEVTVGSRTLPATVHVAEVVDLRIEPQEVTIIAGAPSSYTRKITVESRSNVELALGTRCETPIFESADLLSSMLIGLHKADKDSAESMVKGFLREWAELQAGMLVIKREPLILRPGQKVAIDIEFELPPELKPQRFYRTSAQLYNASLSINIYTTAKVGSGRDRKLEPKLEGRRESPEKGRK